MTRDVVDLMERGTPVLVIPHAGCFDSVDRNVLIARRPTRKCARAVEAPDRDSPCQGFN